MVIFFLHEFTYVEPKDLPNAIGRDGATFATRQESIRVLAFSISDAPSPHILLIDCRLLKHFVHTLEPFESPHTLEELPRKPSLLRDENVPDHVQPGLVLCVLVLRRKPL